MRAGTAMLAAILVSAALVCGCGGSGGGGSTPPTQNQTAPPSVTTFTNAALQNGAVMAALGFSTPGSVIHYTLDGSAPTASSQIYDAPFLVASNLTVKAIAIAPGDTASTVTIQSFTPAIASGALVWSEDFNNATASNALPNSAFWTYDTGTNCCGNNELETYCAAGASAAPCDPANPNAYADTAGILHIVARKPTAAAVYTSARLKSQGLFSFQYGRIEARMKLPEGQGMWPAFWLLGDNITAISWPACGELDVMEHINGSNPQNEGFDWVAGSIHGTNLNGTAQFHPAGFSAADWHTYGMIWTKGQIQFYVDAPANVYATYTPSTQAGIWPFDDGPQFIILNLAVGGDWPGPPDATTIFPSEVLVDYVHVYAN